jgi:hypothetical protein
LHRGKAVRIEIAKLIFIHPCSPHEALKCGSGSITVKARLRRAQSGYASASIHRPTNNQEIETSSI